MKSTLSKVNPPIIQKDEFPYARLSDYQFERWSDQINEDQLPLRAFFAQHRPLMHMKPMPEQYEEPKDLVYVHVWQPRKHLLHDAGFGPVPKPIAQDMGPFNIGSIVGQGDIARESWRPTIAERADTARMQVTLDLIGSLLSRHNNGKKNATVMPSPGSLIHFPIIYGQPYVDMGDGTYQEIGATSVRRKRKLKMNRHKYRKRLKVQRTKRRRLASANK